MFHGRVNALERRAEQHLSSTQTPDMPAIWVEIQELRTDMKTALPAPLVIPMSETTTEAVINLFADEQPLSTSGKRPHLDGDDTDVAR